MCDPRNRNSRIKFALSSLLLGVSFSAWASGFVVGALYFPLQVLSLATIVFALVLDCVPSTFSGTRAYYAWSFLAVIQFFLLTADITAGTLAFIPDSNDRYAYVGAWRITIGSLISAAACIRLIMLSVTGCYAASLARVSDADVNDKVDEVIQPLNPGQGALYVPSMPVYQQSYASQPAKMM